VRLYANNDLQLLTELAGTSQAVQNVSTPRDSQVPLEIIFVSGGLAYEPDAVDVTVADEAARFRLVEIAATITSSSIAASSVITATGHGLLTGDTATIAGHTGSTPAINGVYAITKIDADTFSIPIAVTVGGTGGTATKAAGSSLGQFVLQVDTGDRYKVISVADLGSVAGYLIKNLSIKWLVKEEDKFDGDVLASCTVFEKIGTGTAAYYLGYVNYITAEINALLFIDPPDTTNDVVSIPTMAQLIWSGAERGKTDWVLHTIKNDLERDEDVDAVAVNGQSGKTAITNGQDYVEITFGTAYADAAWHFVGAPLISNTVDADPLIIAMGPLTERTAAGFKMTFLASTDSSNYKLEWIVTPD